MEAFSRRSDVVETGGSLRALTDLIAMRYQEAERVLKIIFILVIRRTARSVLKLQIRIIWHPYSH